MDPLDQQLNEHMADIDRAEAEGEALEAATQEIYDKIISDPEYLLEALSEAKDVTDLGKAMAGMIAENATFPEFNSAACDLAVAIDSAVTAYAASLAPARVDEWKEAAEEAKADE